MPVDMSRYPDDWPAISKRIKERDSNRCKFCGVENGAVGYRNDTGDFVKVWNSISEVDNRADAMALDGIKVIRIVLTVAHHPDPDPMNCADDNLRALCQKCHNTLDMPMRQQHAAKTRRARAVSGGQAELL